MEQKIELIHPAGKKAVSMDKQKYDLISNALFSHIKTSGNATHTEMLKSISDDFIKNNIEFLGSLEWYLEWVKLDLEARNIIKRLDGTTPAKYSIT